jgi:acyl dehydratase
MVTNRACFYGYEFAISTAVSCASGTKITNGKEIFRLPLNLDKLLTLKIPAVAQSYGPKDCILYALGLGLGQDPLNKDELAFVYEKNFKVLPTYALMQGYSPYWLRDAEFGLTWTHVVHGEQGFRLHAPVKPQGEVIGRTRIVDVVDKGEGRGALIYSEREIIDRRSGDLLATLQQTTFCRADGGFGGPRARKRPAPPHPIPGRAPDLICNVPTRPEMALVYRLSGDVNPLHADPDFAQEAGFPRPILHGLASMGVAGHALLKTLCGYDPAGLTSMSVRFSAPVFPGETVRVEIWRDGAVASFRARVMERDVVVIDNGRAEIKG